MKYEVVISEQAKKDIARKMEKHIYLINNALCTQQ